MRDEILSVIDTLDGIMEELTDENYHTAASSVDEAILNLYDAAADLR